MPALYIIGGCNGAGKTTASYTVLPEMLNCREFVNADEIAKGLSPFQPETVSFEAGRIMLSRIKDLLSKKIDFAFETTLATKSHAPLITLAQAQGYTVTLVYFWLESVELAKQRVNNRVKKGGHNIPKTIIERRYYRGLQNFFTIFKTLVNAWFFYDNSDEFPVKIAEGNKFLGLSVYKNDIWETVSKNREYN